jgi:MFS family permease
MDEAYKRRLEKNIGKYSWYKVFTKRVYLPLITIQLVNVGHVTISQIAVIAAASSIISIILQVPAGYMADKWGNKRAIIFGTAVLSISPLFYIFNPSFAGGLTAALLFFGGSSFTMGATEAFMHDTLVELGKADIYAKVLGRAQSYGLIGNIVLITAIPATYSINHALPFLLGFISLVVLLLITISFTYPERSKVRTQNRNPFAATKSIITKQNITIFLLAGFMAGVSNRGGEYNTLVFQQVGIQVVWYGAIAALGSVAGAIMGRYLQVLDNLKPLNLYLFDVLFLTGCVIFVGAGSNPAFSILGFTLFMGYGRVRLILIQSKLLSEIKHVYKATLLSALNLFSNIGEILAIFILARLVNIHGLVNGYVWFGLASLAIGLVLWMFVGRAYKSIANNP